MIDTLKALEKRICTNLTPTNGETEGVLEGSEFGSAPPANDDPLASVLLLRWNLTKEDPEDEEEPTPAASFVIRSNSELLNQEADSDAFDLAPGAHWDKFDTVGQQCRVVPTVTSGKLSLCGTLLKSTVGGN